MGAWAWAFWLCGATCGIIGMVLLARVVALKRAPGRVCRGCEYDMAGTLGLTCSECGRVARSERELGRRQWNLRLALAGMLCVLLGVAAAWTPRVRERGWLGATPTLVLAIGARVQGECPEELLGEINRRVPKGERLGATVSTLIVPRLLEGPGADYVGNSPGAVRWALSRRLFSVVDEESLEGGVWNALRADGKLLRREGALANMTSFDPSARHRRRVLEIATDEDDPAQIHAVRVLGLLSDDERLPVIARVLNAAASVNAAPESLTDKDAVAYAAMHELRHEQAVTPEVIEALWRVARARFVIRFEAMGHLVRFEPTRIAELCALSKSAYPRESQSGQESFLDALGESGRMTPGCEDCLRSYLVSGDDRVRTAAVRAIGRTACTNFSTQIALVKIAQTDRYPRARASAVLALVECGASRSILANGACLADPAVWVELLGLAQMAPLRTTRMAATFALVESGAPWQLLTSIVCSLQLTPDERALLYDRLVSAGEVVPDCLRETAK